jgi:hypothetical protein
VVSYFGGDRNRQFDIEIDSSKVASVKLSGTGGDRFVTERYAIPPAAIRENGGTMVVRFAASNNAVAGGVFDIRVVRKDAVANGTP